MAFCSQCGTELKPGTTYCPQCGARQPDVRQADWAPAQERAVSWDPELNGKQTKEPKKKGRHPVLKVLLIVVLVFAAAVGLLLALGSSSSMEEDVKSLVQGNLDCLYLGRWDDDYRELVSSTPEELQRDYEAGIQVETDYFMEYFLVEYPTQELEDRVGELYKEIYAYSNYTVNEATELDDGSYAVRVQIRPIDIMHQAYDSFDDAMAAVDEKYAGADFDNMSEEEYAAYDHDWAQAAVDLVESLLPQLGYEDEETVVVRVAQDAEGIWRINQDDLGQVDEYIIYYP